MNLSSESQLVEDFINAVETQTDGSQACCVPLLHHTGVIPKAWMNAEIAIHAHFSVRIGETESRDLCALFERQRDDVLHLLQQRGVRYPSEAADVGKHFVDTQGSVFVQVGKVGEKGEDISSRVGALVRLRLLNECPHWPVDWQSEQGAALWVLLATDLIDKSAFGGAHRVGVPPTWFFPRFDQDSEAHGVVQRDAGVLDKVTKDQTPADDIWLRDWADLHYPPGTISLKFYVDTIGVVFLPSVDFRVQGIHMFIGASELRPRPEDTGRRYPPSGILRPLHGESP